MRQLVLADGYDITLAEENVAGLVDRVCQKQAGERMARCLLLGLDGWIALELGLAHEREERQHELIERGNCGVREDHRLGRINAAGKVVNDDVIDVIGDIIRRVAIGNDLIICNDDVGVYAAVLQIDTPLERPEVMPEVQPAP